MKKQKIAFDFDKVFVDYPPFIPSTIIDFLYKRKNGKLAYRYPGSIEKQIRILSHHHFFRSPLKNNIAALSKIHKDKNIETYIISSRYSFLKNKTNAWNKKNNIAKYFSKMYFNYRDEQPHVFKEKILRSESIDKFIDDDYDLLIYLSKRNPDISFYWITNSHPRRKLPANVVKIKDINEFATSYA